MTSLRTIPGSGQPGQHTYWTATIRKRGALNENLGSAVSAPAELPASAADEPPTIAAELVILAFQVKLEWVSKSRKKPRRWKRLNRRSSSRHSRA
jgi:hypothetical protein